MWTAKCGLNKEFQLFKFRHAELFFLVNVAFYRQEN